MSAIEPLKKNCYDYALEIVAWIGLILSFNPLLFYKSLDKNTLIPIHYNLYGEIDGWGSLSFLWIIPIIAAVFYIGFSISERYYKKFNYPIKITSNNSQYVYRIAVQLMRTLKALFLIIFAYINNISLAYAYGYKCSFNNHIMPFFIIMILAVVIIYYIKIIKYKE